MRHLVLSALPLLLLIGLLNSCGNPLEAFQSHRPYRVTYVSALPTTGGVLPATTQHMPGDTVIVQPGASLTRTGYAFTLWNSKAEGSGKNFVPGTTFTMSGFDVTLFAQWASLYGVTYEGSNPTWGDVPLDAYTYNPGDPVTVLGNVNGLSRVGMSFSGWTTLKNGQGTLYTPGQTVPFPASGLVLWAYWTGPGVPTYTVTYDANNADSGNTPVDTIAYVSGSKVVLPNANFLRVGYSFDGWNTLASGLGTFYNFGDQVTVAASNLILFAKWTVQGTPHSVTYNGNAQGSGSPPTDGNLYLSGQQFPAAGSNGMLKPGYEFTGWNLQSDGLGTHFNVGTPVPMPATNLTLWAEWKNYTLTLDGNGNDSLPFTTVMGPYVTGDTPLLPNQGTFTKAGASFGGWNSLPSGMGVIYSVGSPYPMSSQNATVFAVWIPTYTVTYSTDLADSGGVPTASTAYSVSDPVTVFDNTGGLVRSGYLFNGWNTQIDRLGMTVMPAQWFSMPANNVTLYPVWTEACHLTYLDNGATGGTVPNDPTVYLSGTSATVQGNSGGLFKLGFTFAGWTLNAGGTGTVYQVSDLLGLGSDLTLYAKWVTHTPVDFFVDANGNNANNGLSGGLAFQSITWALTQAQAGDTIHVAPGTYDLSNLETFPLVVPDGVTVLGDEGTKGSATLIYGGGEALAAFPGGFGSFAVVLRSNSTLAGFTITNVSGIGSFPMGMLLHDSYVSNNVTVRNNTFTGSTSQGLYVAGGSQGILDSNVFQGNLGLGLCFVGGGGNDMQVTGNLIDDEFEMDTTGPDFGLGSAGSPGLNIWLTQSAYFGSGGMVYVRNNYWGNNPPVEGTLGSSDYTLIGGTGIDISGAMPYP